MAGPNEEQRVRQDLSQALDELAQLRIEDLERKDLGPLNFRSGEKAFARVLDLFRELHKCSLDTFPLQTLQSLLSVAKQAREYFTQVEEFDLDKHPENPRGVRDDIVKHIDNAYQNYFQHITPVIAFATRKGTDFSRLESEARQTVERLKEAQALHTETMDKATKEAQAILEAVRKAAQEAGVAQHSIHFQEEAANHLESSKSWLKMTALLASLALVFWRCGIGLVLLELGGLDFEPEYPDCARETGDIFGAPFSGVVGWQELQSPPSQLRTKQAPPECSEYIRGLRESLSRRPSD